MAFYNEEDEDQLDPNAPQQTGGESATIGSGGGAAAGAAEAGAGAAQAPKGENFVGISQYIEANKPQSQKLAGQVAGNVNDKAAAAESGLSNAQNSFNQAADAQRVNVDQGLFDEVKNNAQGVVSDEAKLGSFAKAKNAGYTGPQNIEEAGNWGDLQSALSKARQAKEATGTEEGRMGLIKEISNNPRQSQGALTFDNLLLQSNKDAAGMLQNAGSSLNDIDTRMSGAQSAAQAKAKEVAAANAATKKSAQDAVSGGWQGLSQSLADREAAADAKAKADFEEMFKTVSKNGQFTPEQLLVMGLNNDSKTYGTNLTDFMKYADNIDKYGVANQDDMARQAALRQLAGDDELGDDLLSSLGELGKQGPNFGFDTNAFNTAAQAKKDEFNALYGKGDDWNKKLGTFASSYSNKNDYYASPDVLKNSILATGDLPKDLGNAYRSVLTPGEYNAFLDKLSKSSAPNAGKALEDALPKRLKEAQQRDYDDGGSYLTNPIFYADRTDDIKNKQSDYFGMNDTVGTKKSGILDKILGELAGPRKIGV